MVGKTKKQGFTLIELLVVIAIIAILAAILFPVFNAAKDSAMQAKCLSNMKQLGAAQMMYLQEYGVFGANRWHEGNNWTFYFDDLQRYIKNENVYRCPKFPKDRHTYGMTDMWGWPQNRGDQLATKMPYGTKGTVLMMEMHPDRDDNGNYYPWNTIFLPANFNNPPCLRFSHHGGMIVLYVDGHAGWVKHGKLMYYQVLTADYWRIMANITKDGPLRDRVKGVD